MILLITSLVLSVLVLTTSLYFYNNVIISSLFLLLAPILCIFRFTVRNEGHSIQVNINRQLLKPVEWSSKPMIVDLGITVGSVLIYMLCVHFSLMEFAYTFLKCFVFLLPIVHVLIQRNQAYFLTNAFFGGAMVIFWTSIVNFKSMSEEIGISLIKSVLLRDVFLWGLCALAWGILGECLLKYYKNKSEKSLQ